MDKKIIQYTVGYFNLANKMSSGNDSIAAASLQNFLAFSNNNELHFLHYWRRHLRLK